MRDPHLCVSRRGVLAQLGFSLLATSAPTGCALFIEDIPEGCVNDRRYSDPSTPLTIDTHVHVFNGSDLQVGKFYDLVLPIEPEQGATVRSIGDVLQEIAWENAPSGATELRKLGPVRAAILACNASALEEKFLADRQEGYELGKRELRTALRTAERSGALEPYSVAGRDAVDELRRQVEDLPQSAADYEGERHAAVLGEGRSDIAIRSNVDFILRNFQYRYVNVFQYLRDFSDKKHRKVDLLVAHLVDYDWPIARGAETPTRFDRQVAVMKEIAILTGGRIHCFAPFDPLRAVMHRHYGRGFDPHGFVRQAVRQDGFIGVKLYPPMGFGLYGNAKRQESEPNLWNRHWLPAELRRADLGALIDAELAELYHWCRPPSPEFPGGEDVPIMGHSNLSLGPHADFIKFAGVDYWKAARDEFAGLRASFGHFGDTEPVMHRDRRRAEAFAALMTPEPGSPGENLYADSSYFMESITDPDRLRARLRGLYVGTEHKGTAALSHRLMYGTDWEMISREGSRFEDYLLQFEAIIDALDADPAVASGTPLSRRFFGENAVDFLGLRQGEATRRRLEAFYDRNRVPDPIWMQKVDHQLS